MEKTLIVAHRGASALAKENTIASFAKAIEIGADMIEFDVRRTKDRVLVAYHDPTIGGHPLSKLTLDEANRLTQAKGVTIPTVEEVVKLTRGKIRLDVEIKETGYESDIIELLLKYLELEEFVITSFQDRTVKTIKEIYPQVRAGLLLGDGQPHRSLVLSFPDLFPNFRVGMTKADFLVAHYRLLRWGFLSRAARNHQQVYVWTVNDPGLIEKLMADPRVSAVISDKPDLALSILKSAASHD